ncbi:divalent metal cation transporter [Thalassotalea psychrophila]|uniref:Divalent metal cation transporter n=1 Tax=Thalassotalea psychrophila TaxID=3065647 RepID=A0ABY9TYC1_9GAMM|nr:divalent metal cation transporter [Colwelliaceae bacterium SQ149]
MQENILPTDEQRLLAAKAKGHTATLKAYMSLSGPGWLQSALTLGGGSLAGALFVGVIGGLNFLWVQLFAMIIGVIMLSAIAYVTLSSGQSPYKLIRDQINPVMAWGWLISALLANMIWVMPQYALSYSAITENLGLSLGGGIAEKAIISLVIFAICTAIVMTYGQGSKGQKFFDLTVKIVVAAIVLTFMAVAFKIVFIDEVYSLSDIAAGFVPSSDHFTSPQGAIAEQLAKLDASVQPYWRAQILNIQQTVLIAAAAFAVGVNMTFMMPSSLMARGWNKNFRGLAIFDLSTGMLIPFVLATSCIVIASAATFHGQSQDSLIEVNGHYQVNQQASQKVISGLENSLKQRSQAISEIAISDEEKVMASYLIKRDTGSFIKALERIMGPEMAHFVFGLGVLAMGLSTIVMLMLISGFCVCELGGYKHGGKEHKRGTLLATTGLLWFVVWTGGSAPYLAAITGTIGFIFLPIAYIAFFMLLNSKKAMGENAPTGKSRTMWNLLMGGAIIFTCYTALGPYGAWGKMLGGFPIGQYFVIAFVLLAIAGQLYMRNKHKKVKLMQLNENL